MSLKDIKETFTRCYLYRRNSSVEMGQDSLINQTDENEIVKEIKERNFMKNGMKKSASETKIIHNIPSSLIKGTKEDKARLEYVLVMNNLRDYNMI